MGWGQARRPRISNKLGGPNPREGGDGDIQIRQTNLGAKLFGKVGGRWYESPLSYEGVTKYGTSLTNYLSIDNDSIDIIKNNKKVSSFGSDIQFNGKIVIGNPDGTFGNDDNIVIGNDQSELGVYNISIGYQAGKALLATGSSNVSIGYTAGTAITTGGNNVFIGAYAGDGIINGSYNNITGYQARTSSSSVSYEIVISSSALTGQGTETVTIGRNSDYITCDFGENATWSHSSDLRIKKDIADNNLGLSFINDLRTVTFKKKASSEYPEEFESYESDNTERKNPDLIHYGFIAQEVKEAMDNANHSEFTVWKENKDGMQLLGETQFITPLVKAVQELSAKIDTMQTEINNLKQG